MRLDYTFSNLCGVVYKKGNLVFTGDGKGLLSPVGNRVSLFDLVGNKSLTLPFENLKNIAKLALSPDQAILLSIDEEGRALLINFKKRTLLGYFRFKETVKDIQFSPDSRFFAVTCGKRTQVWLTPSDMKQYNPFHLYRTYGSHYDDIKHISWSPDSRFFLTTSKDMSCRIMSLDPIPGFTPVTLTGHRDTVVAAYFSKDMQHIFTIAKDGVLIQWRFVPQDDAVVGQWPDISQGSWTVEEKFFFSQNYAKVTCCAFHADTGLLVVGFSSGIFGLYNMPDFNKIHSLSISQKTIDTVTIDPTGEWLAFGAAKVGQLLVWEWQSETYILKQQGHYFDTNCVAYSGDGKLIATGGEDGKVKIWNTQTGFCFVTFTEHAGAITHVQFCKTSQVVVSASRDGTVRAFDLLRFRNFKTFTAPTPAQYGALAVDAAGDVICAGTLDTFELHVWSMQTGQLLDIFSGHQGPIVTLAFCPRGQAVASGSWDKTVRIWDLFSRKMHTDTLTHTADVLALAYRPDGKELCVSTLQGDLVFWNVEAAEQSRTIEGRHDLVSGRRTADRVTAENATHGKAFRSLCYSADGLCVLGGGDSKFICLYGVAHGVLLKKFELSRNKSLDGVVRTLDARHMTEAGPMALIDDDEGADGYESDMERRMDTSLPGVASGDLAKRTTKPMVCAKQLTFSPTGRSWAAATTEGLLLYTLDDGSRFDPVDLDADLTPDAIAQALRDKMYLKALVMALRLNEFVWLERVWLDVPRANISLVAEHVPSVHVNRLLAFLGAMCEASSETALERLLLWSAAILRAHGTHIKQHAAEMATSIRLLHKGISQSFSTVNELVENNMFRLKFYTSAAMNGCTEEER